MTAITGDAAVTAGIAAVDGRRSQRLDKGGAGAGRVRQRPDLREPRRCEQRVPQRVGVGLSGDAEGALQRHRAVLDGLRQGAAGEGSGEQVAGQCVALSAS